LTKLVWCPLYFRFFLVPVVFLSTLRKKSNHSTNSEAKYKFFYLISKILLDYKDDALDIILEETEGYPFFLQVWGSHAG